jgi:hypothetical protein
VVEFLVFFLLILALLAPLWLAGMISLLRAPSLRAIGITCLIPVVVFLFVGKGYYPAPTVPLVMAQGLIAMTHLNRTRLRTWLGRGVVVAMVLDLVALFSFVMPVTPPDRLHSSGLDISNPDLAATVGWPQVTEQITAMYTALTPAERTTTVIITSDYGAAGALQVYGNTRLLPAVYSPQLSDALWLPARVAASDALMVGYAPSDISWMCTSSTVVGHLAIPYGVVNIESGAPVTFCHLRAPIPSIWTRLRNDS